MKNHTFFFLNYEGLRQRVGTPLTGFVPSLAFLQKTIQSTPAIASLLNAHPTDQTQSATNADVDTWTGTRNLAQSEDFGLFRLDQQFSPKNLPSSEATSTKGDLFPRTAMARNSSRLHRHAEQPEERRDLGANGYNEGLAPVKLNGKWGYIDKKGETVIPFDIDLAASFNSGLAAFAAGSKWGFLRKDGSPSSPPGFRRQSHQSRSLPPGFRRKSACNPSDPARRGTL